VLAAKNSNYYTIEAVFTELSQIVTASNFTAIANSDLTNYSKIREVF
jgi:hypothetical protein